MGRKIALFVIGGHFALLLVVVITGWRSPPPAPPKPIQVTTMKLQPTPVVVTAPKVVAAAPPLKAKKKKVKKLVQQAEKKIAKVEKKGKKKASSPPPPPKSIAYNQEIAERLQLMLCLPEYGSVKVSLTLTRSGNIKGLEVLNTHNERNRSYVLEELPKMVFPPFGSHFGDEQQHTFVLTLNNG